MSGTGKGVRASLEWESAQFDAGVTTVIGVDEVGRGAIAGPVAVGAAAVTRASGPQPEGLADSKLLTPRRREALAPRIRDWSSVAVGMVDARFIDEHGIVAALGLAGSRALDALAADGVCLGESVVLVDGASDWLSVAVRTPLDVRVRVKADRDCASVAAASVVAKTHRDAYMVAAHASSPQYAWDRNKGYGAPAHYAGIRDSGPHEVMHRLTWLRGQQA